MKAIIVMQKLHSSHISFASKLVSKLIKVIYACDIKPTAKVARGVVLVHDGLGCVFHENVVIENGAKIFQNTTFGGSGKENTGLQKGCDHPVVKRGAVIYAGACILGPITIGEDSVVGANAVVLKDVPAGSLAVGVPAVIKPRRKERM